MTHGRRNAAAVAALVLLLVGCSEAGARRTEPPPGRLTCPAGQRHGRKRAS
jgi:hypothetical protein